jgi:hypothetical protein
MTLASEASRGWLGVLLVCVWTRAAAAEGAGADAQARTVARDLAQQGAEAFERGQYGVALDRFTRAQAIFGAPSLSLMRARALRKLGRLTEAVDAYEVTQRTPIALDAPEAFRRAVADARREGAELDARMPRMLVRVRGGGNFEQVRVVLDGKVVPPALLDVERPIDPGRHEIHAFAPGRDPITRHLLVAEGEHVVVDLPFVERAAKRAPAPAASRDASDRDGTSSTRRTLGFVGAGVGTAALGVAAVSGVIALKKQSTLDSVCNPGCPSSAADDIDAFRVNRTISYAGLAVGVLSLGVGGYFLLTSTSTPEQVGVHVSASGVRVGGRF